MSTAPVGSLRLDIRRVRLEVAPGGLLHLTRERVADDPGRGQERAQEERGADLGVRGFDRGPVDETSARVEAVHAEVIGRGARRWRGYASVVGRIVRYRGLRLLLLSLNLLRRALRGLGMLLLCHPAPGFDCNSFKLREG